MPQNTTQNAKGPGTQELESKEEGKSVQIFKTAIYNQNPKQFLLVSCSAPPSEWRFNADYLRLVPQDTEGTPPSSGTEISGVLSQAVVSECIS